VAIVAAVESKHDQASDVEHDRVIAALAHLDHILPAQAPIQDFIHHNTLHGYQHLPFAEALAKAEDVTGISAYLPEAQSRAYYRAGRINDSDIAAALADTPQLQAGQVVCQIGDRTILREAIYRIALLHDLEPITISQLNWQISVLQALDNTQADLPDAVRQQLFNTSDSLKHEVVVTPIRQLWESLCNNLGVELTVVHPEHLLDLALTQSESALVADANEFPHGDTRNLASNALTLALERVGQDHSLRDLIKMVSGCDVLDAMRPHLVRICASVLDEGVAAWPLPERERLGFYGAWRALVPYDIYPFLHELPNWQQVMAELPEDSITAIIMQLQYFEIPLAQWQGYLSRIALELPGWSGMINWLQHNPNFSTDNNTVITLADYLAIRLTLDRLWLGQICFENWKIKPKLSALQAYFQKNLSEFIVRQQLYQGNLPEYLTHLAQALVVRTGSERTCRNEWQHLADLVTNWQRSAASHQQATVGRVWRLFRLFQHLGISAEQVDMLDQAGLLAMLAVMDEFTMRERQKIWLTAYERHYREQLFTAITANRHRGRWAQREHRPSAQIIFCMDDREESIRRHLEEHAPEVETLGAAGFFGVAMNYQGLDDKKSTPLCPVAITPVNNVREIPKANAESNLHRHMLGLKFNRLLASWVQHGFRHNPLFSYLATLALAPLALLGLLAKVFVPKLQFDGITALTGFALGVMPTELAFTVPNIPNTASLTQPRSGFTDDEQAEKVAGFLRNTGLTYGFAPLVVLMGHGSSSQNNPHMAAYDCGACGGRHGGPNARLFAAMANRPEVRQRLVNCNIHIPDGTWFIGAEHNTCNEDITWYDASDMPVNHTALLESFKLQLQHAQQFSAHERCRRLASAPHDVSLGESIIHITGRAADFSQARHELGHATNAAAVIGRRSVTQGAFFDRRVFLISYDASQDPEGTILEGILLAVGPVGAGINLEYYFSTVNNERLGCGTKVPHNIVGKFGVMEGASSDLRTGLPKQMIEIHEAMRLQILVEAKPTILAKIYGRQESLRELIAGSWVFLSTLDPDTGDISIFKPNAGFIPWQRNNNNIAVYANSPECYRGHSLPVAPALIQQPDWTAN
jgi:uncharacterized protein